MFQLLAHNHHCAEDYKVADEVSLKICLVKVLDYNARTIIIPLEQQLPFSGQAGPTHHVYPGEFEVLVRVPHLQVEALQSHHDDCR